MEIRQQIRKILMQEWDPTDVSDVPEANLANGSGPRHL